MADMIREYEAALDSPACIELREVEGIEFVGLVPSAFRILRGDEEVLQWTDGAAAASFLTLQRPRFSGGCPGEPVGELLRPCNGNATSGEPGPLRIEVRGFYRYKLLVWERQ